MSPRCRITTLGRHVSTMFVNGGLIRLRYCGKGQRLGTYYLENGAAMRASKVIYDRAASSIAELGPGEVDWERIFDGKDWFHFTGITPAISESAALACDEAASIAKYMGLTVSADMNYRKNLWSPGGGAGGDAADDESCGCGDWQRGGCGDVVGSRS